MQSKKHSAFFQVGGSLPAGHPSYITRRCDKLLYDALKKNILCTVFAPRQMGKSSLKNKVATKLLKEGFTCLLLDASPLRSLVNEPEKWLYSFAVQVSRKLNMSSQVKEIWNSISKKTAFGVLEDFMQLLLQNEKDGVVLFIDEFDSVVSQDKGFSVSFLYTLINMIKNNTGISICILGVTSIYHILNEKNLSLNKGIYHISLPYLPKNRMSRLISGLPAFNGNRKALVEQVFFYSKGQPYLTQKIFEALSQDIKNSKGVNVTEKVKDLFFHDGALENDSNLSNCMNRINKHPEKKKILSLCSQICNNVSVHFHERDILHQDLLLSGLAIKSNSRLISANPIYVKVIYIMLSKN